MYLNLPTDIECVIRIYLHRTTPSLLGVHLLRWWRLCTPQVRVEVDCLAVMTVTSLNRNYVIRTASQFLFLKMIIYLGRLKNDAWSLCAPCPPHAQSAISDLGNRYSMFQVWQTRHSSAALTCLDIPRYWLPWLLSSVTEGEWCDIVLK
jgi:hypothetical protein